MTPAGTFFYYFSVTFLGFFFMLKYAKETKGLTDCEKKELYKPKAIEQPKEDYNELNVTTDSTIEEIELKSNNN